MPNMRVGILGKRGLACVPGIRSVPGVSVTAFCDLDPATAPLAAEAGIDLLPASAEELFEAVDAVVVATPMHLHASQATSALRCGLHVLSEVTAAVTIDACRELAATVERASATYSFAENYCYFRECLIARHLAGQGRFGELYFGEGDYVHEVRFLHADATGKPTWRKRWQVGARGNTYATHELGPLMQWFRAADPTIRIVSVACFGTGAHTDPSLPHDDCTLTMVQLSNGGLLELRLDMVSNRPHRIGYALQGTRGVLETEDRYRIWLGENRTRGWDDPPREWEDLFSFEAELPETLRAEMAEAANAGHGGGDFFVGRRFAQTIALGAEPEIGVAEAVEWTMAGLLSQQSIAQGSTALPMPAWVYEGR